MRKSNRMALIAASLTFIMIALSAVSAMAKGNGGVKRPGGGTACSARLLSDGNGGVSLLLETTDRKADRVDIFDDDGGIVVAGIALDKRTALVIDANFVLDHGEYHALFIRVSQKGESIRCVADFGIPDVPGTGG